MLLLDILNFFCHFSCEISELVFKIFFFSFWQKQTLLDSFKWVPYYRFHKVRFQLVFIFLVDIQGGFLARVKDKERRDSSYYNNYSANDLVFERPQNEYDYVIISSLNLHYWNHILLKEHVIQIYCHIVPYWRM